MTTLHFINSPTYSFWKVETYELGPHSGAKRWKTQARKNQRPHGTHSAGCLLKRAPAHAVGVGLREPRENGVVFCLL